MGKRIHWVPAAAHFNLTAACQVVNNAFREDGYGCYHVGSSLIRGDYQDVDVRYVMSDDGFAKWFGSAENLHLNPVWALMCTAIGTWLSKQSGLPVDFQIQQMTAANAEFSGERRPIGYPWPPNPADYGKDPQ